LTIWKGALISLAADLGPRRLDLRVGAKETPGQNSWKSKSRNFLIAYGAESRFRFGYQKSLHGSRSHERCEGPAGRDHADEQTGVR